MIILELRYSGTEPPISEPNCIRNQYGNVNFIVKRLQDVNQVPGQTAVPYSQCYSMGEETPID